MYLLRKNEMDGMLFVILHRTSKGNSVVHLCANDVLLNITPIHKSTYSNLLSLCNTELI